MCGPSAKNTTTFKTSSKDQTPILSDDWIKAYKNSSNNLGANGLNSLQNQGLGMLNQAITDRPYQASAVIVNNDLMGMRGDLEGLGAKYDPYTKMTTPTATADTGASFMGAYKNPFDRDVIDASVNDYNTNVDRTSNAMRAGRDSAGAFGDRSAIADAVYQGDASRGLGSLVSGLRQTGFNTAAGLGQQDAARSTDVSKFNAGQELQNRVQQMGAIGAQERNIAARAGISQQILDNVFTNNQVNMDYATKLFQTGQISQEQLNTITQLAERANGTHTKENSLENELELTTKAI